LHTSSSCSPYINKQDSQPGCSHACHTLFQLLCTERLEINASLEKTNQPCNRICYIGITASVAISDWQTNRRPLSPKMRTKKADHSDESRLPAPDDVPTAPLRRLEDLADSRALA
tara:strand:- start:3462 stop:3806 length:345 start_codon:yes stop_codon:yes gene_type:complete